MIAGIYARKSNQQEGAHGTSESVERQIEHARAYIARKGWTVAEDHVLYDDDVSGATYTRLAARNKLVDIVEAGTPPFQALVISEQSRLGQPT